MILISDGYRVQQNPRETYSEINSEKSALWKGSTAYHFFQKKIFFSTEQSKLTLLIEKGAYNFYYTIYLF